MRRQRLPLCLSLVWMVFVAGFLSEALAQLADARFESADCLLSLNSSLGPCGSTYEVGETIPFSVRLEIPYGSEYCTLVNVCVYYFPPPLGLDAHPGYATPCEAIEDGLGTLIFCSAEMWPGDWRSYDLPYVVQPSDECYAQVRADMGVVFSIQGSTTEYCDFKTCLNNISNESPEVTVLAPNGGEAWYIGDTEDITWTATDVCGVISVSIAYSTNGGADYALIAFGEANDGVYPWTIPNTPSSNAFVKVTAYDEFSGGEDVSDTAFEIAVNTPPSVTVLTPNGGETWYVGDTEDVTWTATDDQGVASIDIYYSSNGGADYTLIASGEADDGVYPWTIPGPCTDNALVKVIAYDPSSNAGQDLSDAVFTIADVTSPTVTVTSPNGGEAWYVCGSEDITWTATDAYGVDSVSIYYSVNGGGDYALIASGEDNDGTYTWSVPDMPTGNAMVKVVAHDPSLNAGEDTSDGVFEFALPLIADWMSESDQAGALHGQSVSSAGDVNGDGYDDVIVGAYRYDKGETNEGCAYVYHGSASGLSVAPDWTAEGDQGYAEFGHSVSTAGDVNRDGYDDVIVGAWRYDNPATDEGRAYVYYGSASGLSATSAWTAESDQASARFGISVSTAGDVNGDGYDDVIVGASYYDNGESSEGRAYVYHGSASGLSVAPDWTAEGDQVGAYFGQSVSSAGDVNGDGYSDVIVGAYGYNNGEMNEGRAYVYHGSASGLSVTADWTVESDQANAYSGYSVSSAGDVNGDGYDDVIVGAGWYDNVETDEGAAFVYYGSASGLSGVADWAAESNQESAGFGRSVSGAGAVLGFGFEGVIVGASEYDLCEDDEGCAFVFYGPVGTVDVPGEPVHTHSDAVFQNYPNPFRVVSGTTIVYSVESAGTAEVHVFDSSGRLVRTIADRAEVGENRLHWDGKGDDGGSVPSGVYFCQLKTGGFTSQKKMMLVQ